MNRCISGMPASWSSLFGRAFLQRSRRRRSFTGMRTVEQWFGEYGESHSNPRNELLHIICVPPIVMTVIGFIWSIPVPEAFSQVSPWLNWATIVIALAIVYYFTLSAALGAGAAIALGILAYIVSWLDTLAW